MESLASLMTMVNRLFQIISQQLSAIHAISSLLWAPINFIGVCVKYQIWIVCLPYNSMKILVNKAMGMLLPSNKNPIDQPMNNHQQPVLNSHFIECTDNRKPIISYTADKPMNNYVHQSNRCNGHTRITFCNRQRLPRNAAELLTGSPNPDLKLVLDSNKELRNAALKFISSTYREPKKEEPLPEPKKEDHYRVNLEKLNRIVDSKVEQSLSIDADEKDMVNKITQAIRNFGEKKKEKEKVFCENLTRIMATEFSTTEDLKLLKNDFKKVNGIESNLQDESKNFINSFNNMSQVDQEFVKSMICRESLCRSFQGFSSDIYLDKVQAMCDKMKWEKIAVQENLKSTNDKLEKILDLTTTIKELLLAITESTKSPASNEIENLKAKLAENESVLKDVESERNSMKEKLELLEMLIDDQESFLNSRIEDDLSTDYDELSSLDQM